MITWFNRRELVSTYDMKVQSRVRELLAAEGIDYRIRAVNRKSPSPLGAGSRARTGTLGEKPELAYEYTIYVKKTDYDRAARIAAAR